MRAFTLLALLGALAIPVAGCGGGDDNNDNGGGGGGSSGGGGSNASTTQNTGGAGSSGGGGAQTLQLAADPSGALKFDKSSLSANAGKVTIMMDNPSALPHSVAIEGKGVDVRGKTVEKGGVSKVSADLKAGKYEFYCPVDSHKQAGMEGTLTIK